MSQLRRAVASHFNSLPPHPGYDAHTPPPPQAAADRVRALFTPAVLRELETSGYVVLDDAFPSGGGGSRGGGGGGEPPDGKTLGALHAFMEREGEKTGQIEHRSDRVKFLNGEVRAGPAKVALLRSPTTTTQHDPPTHPPTRTRRAAHRPPPSFLCRTPPAAASPISTSS